MNLAGKILPSLLENEAYANIVSLGNLQFAIKNPSSCFKEVVHEYFRLKGEEIVKDIMLWYHRNKIADVTYSGIAKQNLEWCNKLITRGAYEQKITESLDEFKSLIIKVKKEFSEKMSKKA